MGSRARSINFKEFEMLLKALELSPDYITSMDAANIFRKANRASEVHHDNDVHELNFEEFASMMQDCALYANSSVQGSWLA